MRGQGGRRPRREGGPFARVLQRALAATYRVLLGVYPRDFREAHGVEMTDAFRRGCADTVESKGVPGLLAAGGAELADVLRTAARMRVRGEEKRGKGDREAVPGADLLGFGGLDLKQALRMVRRTPGTSFMAAFALALGIGLTTLMFTVVYGALLRGLPFPDASELVRATVVGADNLALGVPVHDLLDWRDRQRGFVELGAYTGVEVNLGGEGVPLRLRGARLSEGMLGLLGVRPILGRGFAAEDAQAGAPPVILIRANVWRSHFQGDPGVIGRVVRVNGAPVTVIGVLPQDFGFPELEQAWLPLRLDASVPRGRGPTYAVLGRLREGVSLEQARADMERISLELAGEYPATNAQLRIRVERYTTMVGAQARAVLWTAFGAVVFVLLIACANVSHLMVGRAMVRSREIAVRAALGATRWRIAGQFLGESFVLAVAGALLGAPIAYVGIRLFRDAIASTEPPYWIRFELDAVPMLFVCGAIVLVTLVAGTLPALQSARANTRDALQDQSRGSSSFRLGRINRGLTVLQTTLAVALLAAAGLMIRSVVALHRIDFGFAAERVLHADVLPADTAQAAPMQLPVFADALFQRMATLPGVDAVALTASAPGLSGPRESVRVRGQSYDEAHAPPLVASIAVTPGFFALFGAEVLRGRDFQAGDVAGALPVAIVNRAFEQRYFGEGGALGGQIQPAQAEADGPWLTIVGVVPDLYASGTAQDDGGAPAVYRPIAQSARLERLSVVARGRAQPAALLPSVREAVASLDADAALLRAGSLRDVVRAESSIHVIFGSLFMTFGVAALFLASVGLYGVMSFSVGQRRRELGVRLAVGANRRDVLRLVMWQGLRQTMVGLVLGTALALAISRVLGALLFQVSAQDPLTFAGVVFVLLASASLASYVPARRAMRANPIDALRME